MLASRSAGRSPPAADAPPTPSVAGHDGSLRQIVIARSTGAALAEHENPGEATVRVMTGRVHSRSALEDSSVLRIVVAYPDVGPPTALRNSRP
jgi:hypothetical protein